MTRAIFDTNLLIDWMNDRTHEELLLFSSGMTRYMSATVALELRAGATTPRARKDVDWVVGTYRRVGRVVAPAVPLYEEAGDLLRRLRARGLEVRQASLVNDVLIALTARSIGATLFTRDGDFAAIRDEVKFSLELVRGD